MQNTATIANYKRTASPAEGSDFELDAWNVDDGLGELHQAFDEDQSQSHTTMREANTRPTLSRQRTPLLYPPTKERSSPNGSIHEGYDGKPRKKLHERDPRRSADNATRKRYIYASFFLVVSLFAFVIQTETAVYIQRDLGWNKAYAML